MRENQTSMSFEAWYDERKLNCPQFYYWTTTMELELCILTYVWSLREGNFAMYLDITQTMLAGYKCI